MNEFNTFDHNYMLSYNTWGNAQTHTQYVFTETLDYIYNQYLKYNLYKVAFNLFKCIIFN